MKNQKRVVNNITLFTETSGFVYGATGFVDRSFVGITIMVLQNYCPYIPKHSVPAMDYFRWVLVFVNGGLIFVSIALTAILLIRKRKL